MQFSAISFVLFFLSFGLFSYAAPVEERSVTAVLDIVADLQVQVDVVIKALVALDVQADIDVQINALITAFVSASAQIDVLAVVDLTVAEQATIAASIAASLNACATQLDRFPQGAAVIALLVKLDVQVQLFLNVLAVVVVGILDVIAKLKIDIQLLIDIRLTLVANIFIDILGIIL